MADDPKPAAPAPAPAKPAAAPAPISQTAVVRPVSTDPGGPTPVSPEPTPPPPVVEQPPVAPAPSTMEDATRVMANAPTRTFPGFPKDKFHPVQGKVTVNDPNEVAALVGPAHNWFDTAEEADMHRTDAEARRWSCTTIW